MFVREKNIEWLLVKVCLPEEINIEWLLVKVMFVKGEKTLNGF